MGNTIRRQHQPAFKVKVVLEILSGLKTVSQVCSEYAIHPTQAQTWKTQALGFLENSFNGQSFTNQLRQKDEFIEELYKQIGKLKYEVDWLKKRWELPVSEKIKLIEKDNLTLSVREQCALLQLNRSNLYYERKPILSDADILTMNKIDEIFTKRPYYGVPRITKALNKPIFMANHKRVYRLMGIMGIEAVFPKPDLSKPSIAHDIYPYLLTDLKVSHPNHVWGVDITYIRLRGDWLYLFVVLDWFSRYILSWELSDSLSSDFCCETLKRALTIAVPDIHNSDQGSQLTGLDYISILKNHPEIKISMDHKGRCFDNIFTERLWRTIKYEEVYLKDYQSPREARESLTEYLKFYNEERFHSSLNYKTPAEIYFEKSVKSF